MKPTAKAEQNGTEPNRTVTSKHFTCLSQPKELKVREVGGEGEGEW